MNIAMTLKRMTTWDMQSSALIPVAGEVIMDATSDKVKIGDGKSHLKDLPWVDLDLDLAKEESSLSIGAKAFLEDNIDLIDNNDYDTLYSRIATPALAQEITIALLKADLNPKPYLSKIPQSIKHILELEEDWSEDPSRPYTKREIDLKIQTQLYAEFGIPSNFIKVGN